MEIVSAERVRDELSKLWWSTIRRRACGLLSRTGLSDEFLPELNAMRLEQDPVHHHKDVLAHTIAVVGNVRPDLRMRLAALLHDIGKPKTRSFGPGGVSFHHHEVVGARMARERLHALRFPSDLADDVVQLIYLHLRIHTYAMGWTDRAVRRYARDAGPLLDDLNELVRGDCTTRNRKKAAMLARRMDELEERIASLRAQEELDSIRPALDGRQVMEQPRHRARSAGGRGARLLLELRLDEGPMEPDDAYRRLGAWASSAASRPRVTVRGPSLSALLVHMRAIAVGWSPPRSTEGQGWPSQVVHGPSSDGRAGASPPSPPRWRCSAAPWSEAWSPPHPSPRSSSPTPARSRWTAYRRRRWRAPSRST